jgi:hypothetical protein
MQKEEAAGWRANLKRYRDGTRRGTGTARKILRKGFRHLFSEEKEPDPA